MGRCAHVVAEKPARPELVPRERSSVDCRELMNFRLGNRAERCEKIEIAAFVGLADMLRVKRAVAAWVTWCGLFPGSAAAGNFFVQNVQMDAARGHIDFDLVAGLDEGKRTANEAFRRHMQNAGAVARAAHARIGN